MANNLLGKRDSIVAPLLSLSLSLSVSLPGSLCRNDSIKRNFSTLDCICEAVVLRALLLLKLVQENQFLLLN